MVSNVAVVFIGTDKYISFFDGWKKSIDTHFLVGENKELFVFSDTEVTGENITGVKTENYKWPYATLYRFKMINSQREKLLGFDYIFYVDADLHARANIKLSDMIKDGKDFVGVHHPGNFRDPEWYTFDQNPSSSAYIGVPLKAYGENAVYFQGCIWGGKASSVIALCDTLDKIIDHDLSSGIIARWHDESHINKFYLSNLQNVIILPFNYAFPEHEEYSHYKDNYEVKFLHLEKSHNEFDYGIEGEN